MFDKYIISGRRRMFLKKLIWMQMLGLTGGSLLPWQTFVGNPLQFNAPKAHTLKSVKVEFSPIQDLHGYANPWPAGGGKNILPITATTQTVNGTTLTVNNDGTFTVSGTPSAQARIVLSSATFSGLGNITFSRTQSVTGIRYYCTQSDGGSTTYPTLTTTTIDSDVYSWSYIQIEINTTFSGTAVTLGVQIEKGSSSTSWTPYSNLCPISGWTGANIYDTGSNVWDEETRAGYYNATTGVFYEYATQIANKNTISVKPNTTYYLQSGGRILRFVFRDKTGGVISIYNQYGNRTFTTPDNCYGLDFNTFTDYQPPYLNDISINYPSTDTSYHAYNPASWKVAVTWTDEAGTVYGGYLTVAEDGSVDLVGTLAIKDFKNDGLSWGYSPTGVRFSASLPGAKISTTWNDLELLCSVYKNGVVGNNSGPDFAIGVYNATVFVRDTRYTDATVFVNALEGQKIVYELATPVTYHLDSVEQLTALKGINTMWTDADNLEVEARANSVQLNALQSLNMLLGGRYYNNHGADEPTDEEALRILMGGER